MLVSAAKAVAEGKRPRFNFKPGVFLKFIANGLWLRLQGKWFRFGYACVSFGNPVSLRDYMAKNNVDFRTLVDDERFKAVGELGEELMVHVGNVLPALPVPLVASVILHAHPQKLTGFELKGAVFDVMKTLEADGRYVHIPRSDREYAVDVGLRMLTLRHLVTEEDGQYGVAEPERDVLQYYANSIIHLLPPA